MPRTKSRGGRPSKFTPRAVLSIVADISEGKSRDDAAERAGVGASTLYRWIQKGRSQATRITSAPAQSRSYREKASAWS